MADAETAKPPPYIAAPRFNFEIARMGNEGVPDRVDKRYLAGMADGTQFQYRQAFRSLGLTTDDDRPTSLLIDLAGGNPSDRPELFGKIMVDRYPELTGLPLDASKDDFFAVLLDRYGATSDVQRRKMLTFFVAAADYARLPISPHIRPTKARTGPRKTKGRRRTKAPASRPAKAAARTPETRADHGAQDANGSPAERRDISFGDAGSVSIDVNVHWLDLPDEKFTELRKLIKDIEALGDSGS